MRYSGAQTWFARCVLPSCCTVLSADHPSSSVMCALRSWLSTLRSACREMPVEAASEMMQTRFWPDWKASFS